MRLTFFILSHMIPFRRFYPTSANINSNGLMNRRHLNLFCPRLKPRYAANLGENLSGHHVLSHQIMKLGFVKSSRFLSLHFYINLNRNLLKLFRLLIRVGFLLTWPYTIIMSSIKLWLFVMIQLNFLLSILVTVKLR